MMKNADFQMFEVVCDVPDDGDAHDENLELYVLNLSTQLFLGRPFQDFTHLRLALFLFSHFRQSVFLLSLGLSSFDAFGHLPRYFLVAIVNDFNQKISTFIDSCAVEHKSFQNIANDRLMIDGKVKLKRVGRLSKRPYFGQNLFLPGGGHDEIIDEHFILILGDALLQDILIIFHERIDMQLHIQPLQTFILLEPHSASVVPYIDLTYLSDELLYLLVVKDVAESALHAIFQIDLKAKTTIQYKVINLNEWNPNLPLSTSPSSDRLPGQLEQNHGSWSRHPHHHNRGHLLHHMVLRVQKLKQA